MRKNKFSGMLSYDLRNGFRCNVLIFIATIALLILAVIFFDGRQTEIVAGHNQYVQDSDVNQTGEELLLSDNSSSSDYLLFFLRGMKPVNAVEQEQNKKIEVPIMYLALMMIFTVLTGKYMFSGIAKMSVYKSESRRGWIDSKLITNLLWILVIYGIIVGTAMLAGGNNWVNNESYDIFFMKMDYCKASGMDYIKLIITMIFTTMAISMIQIVVSFWSHYFAGILSSIAVYVFSLFSHKIILIGNGCMMQRSECFMEGGYQTRSMMLIDLVVIIVCYVLIRLQMKRRDVM